MIDLIQLKRDIIKDLKNLKKNANIHSLHLIGSHTDENKSLDRLNDFDILVLTNEKLNGNNYSSISKNLNEICNKYNSNEVQMIVETTHANIKLKPKKDTNIQLHQITFFYEDFIKGFNSGNLALHNWVLMGKTIFGKPLRDLVDVKPISKEQLSHERDSIDFFIRIINDKKNIGSAHVIKGDELIKKTIQIPVTEEDELELFFIALNETLGNLLKFTHQKNIIYSFKERIIFLKQNLNNQEYVDVLINLKQIKDRLRNCEKIGYDLNYFKQATLRILKALNNKFKLK